MLSDDDYRALTRDWSLSAEGQLYVDRDLRTDFVATQAVSPVVMVSGSDQFRRTLAGGL